MTLYGGRMHLAKLLKLIAALCLFSGFAAAQSSEPPITIHARHLSELIKVDGVLSEAAWQGPGFTGFLQRDPNQGEQPSERTEVWIGYDDAALYVAARMYDSAPDSIMQILGRRDANVTADWFVFYVDPYHDRRTGYFFGLSAAGTMLDGTMLNDDWDDDSWDGVWEGKAEVDDLGWTVEIRIPFSQLRFLERETYTWGVNLRRVIGRKNEYDYVAYTPRDESGFVSRFADLVDITSIAPQRQVEILPYVNTRAEYLRNEPGDPFNDGSRILPGLGADLKVGLTSNLTLDATVNPDFGQVEVDPAVVNLSDVETYFSEKRPFFIEGANVFEFGYGGSSNNWSFNWSNPNLFYSRRIGRNPQGSLPSYDYADLPLGTHILGAGKLTGRILDGWKLGTIHAVTNREFARIDNSGNHSRVEIEPQTYYGVGRVQRDFNDGRQGFGILGTYAQRAFSDQRLRDELNSSALVGGIDGWTFLDEDKVYVINGWAAVSHVRGSVDRMLSLQQNSGHYFQRPDAPHVRVDSSATSLTGFAGRLALNKQKGEVFLNAAVGVIDPSFDSNDLGFIWRTDIINYHVAAGYRWSTPTEYYRQARIYGAVFGSYDFAGNSTWRGYWTNGNYQFTNYYDVYWGMTYNPFTISNRNTRGGPAMLTLPGREFFMGIESDDRKDIVVSVNGFSYNRTNEPSFSLETSIEWKPSPNVSISAGPYFNRDRSQAQYVDTFADPLATETYGARYVFAVLDQTTVGASLRLNWTFTPQLSLQLFMQPLISAGDYHDFKEFKKPRTFDFTRYGEAGTTLTEVRDADGNLTDYQADPDGPGPASSLSFANPDFNITSIRGNAVLRWEYRPGSTIYLVWTRSSSGYLNDGRFRFGKSFDRLFDGDADNIFMLKFNYWFSL